MALSVPFLEWDGRFTRVPLENLFEGLEGTVFNLTYLFFNMDHFAQLKFCKLFLYNFHFYELCLMTPGPVECCKYCHLQETIVIIVPRRVACQIHNTPLQISSKEDIVVFLKTC